MSKTIASALAALWLAGCAYRAEPVAAPAYNVVTSYGNKIAGKWLLVVDSGRFNETVKPSEYTCSAHSFPVDLQSSFATSVRETLVNIVEQTETVDAALSSAQIKAKAARGLILVRAESLQASLRVVPGFWSANIVTEVNLAAAVTVDSPAGRVFGKTIDGRGKGDTPAGAMCSGGSESLKNAVTQAMQDLLRKAGEEIGNSERVRGAGGRA